jgi:hypothetical protein
MSMADGMEATLAAKFEVLLPHLDERQRRLFLAAEARAFGAWRDQARRPRRRCA